MTTYRSTQNYIDKAELQQLMLEHRQKLDAARETDPDAKIRVSEKIGAMILQIAERFSMSRKFVGYPYREDMVGDCVETCIRYINNYDPYKYNNPFAYFTQICYYANLKRIRIEHTQRDITHDVYEEFLHTAKEMGVGHVDKYEFNNAINDTFMRE